LFEKKENIFKSPDLTKMQEVIIDYRTRIYIVLGANVKEAKRNFIFKYGILHK